KRITAVGDVLQGRQQAELDAQKALFGQAETMPWTQLGRYLAAVSPFNPVFSAATDSTKTTTTPFNSQQAPNLRLTGARLLVRRHGRAQRAAWPRDRRRAPRERRFRQCLQSQRAVRRRVLIHGRASRASPRRHR